MGLGVSLVDCKPLKVRTVQPTENPLLSVTHVSSVGAIDRAILSRLRTTTFVGFVCLGLVVAIHWCVIVAVEARSLLLPKVLYDAEPTFLCSSYMSRI